MILLSSILPRAAEACANEICVSWFESSPEAAVCGLEEEWSKSGEDDPGGPCQPLSSSFSGPLLSVLKYRDACHAQDDHSRWLASVVRSALCPDELAAVNRILAVYLSSNQIDLFLSVLACSSLCMKSQAAHNSNDEGDAVDAVPTLLNSRWTVAEMIQALVRRQRRSGAAPKTKHEHPIVLFYGDGFEATAKDLESRLGPGQCRGCFAIPALSQRYRRQMPASHIPDQLSASSKRPTVFPSCDSIHSEVEKLAASGFSDHPSGRDAVILFTSGTSSSAGAKGVRLSHRAVVIQALAKLLPPVSYSSSSVFLASTVPFYHVGGLSSVVAVWAAGGCLSLPVQRPQQEPRGSVPSPSIPSFVPQQIPQSIRVARVNTLVVVPAMLHALMVHLSKHREQLDRWKQLQQKLQGACLQTSSLGSSPSYPDVCMILVGGQSASEPLLAFCRHAFPSARVVQTYACTEAASSLTFLEVISGRSCSTRYDRGAAAPAPEAPTFSARALIASARAGGDCVGKPPRHVEIALLRDFETSESAPTPIDPSSLSSPALGTVDPRKRSPSIMLEPYQLGVIATRGPHVMNGYWSASTEGATASRGDWLVTSDVGYWDSAGNLWFCGRRTDSIRTGGETVLAGEVERVLALHPSIVDAAVFGLPDDKFGHAVACAIVVGPQKSRQEGGNAQPLTLSDVRRWCEHLGLAGYKRPRHVYRVDSIPKNSSGKTLKYLLVERFSPRSITATNSGLSSKL